MWGLCLLLTFLFGCSNLIMYFSINLVRFEVGASSGAVRANLRLVHYISVCLICQCVPFLPRIFICEHCVWSALNMQTVKAVLFSEECM